MIYDLKICLSLGAGRHNLAVSRDNSLLIITPGSIWESNSASGQTHTSYMQCMHFSQGAVSSDPLLLVLNFNESILSIFYFILYGAVKDYCLIQDILFCLHVENKLSQNCLLKEAFFPPWVVSAPFLEVIWLKVYSTSLIFSVHTTATWVAIVL